MPHYTELGEECYPLPIGNVEITARLVPQNGGSATCPCSCGAGRCGTQKPPIKPPTTDERLSRLENIIAKYFREGGRGG
jgi:hypothetical protein